MGFLSFNLRSYDYNMQVESLLPAHLCLVTLLSSEQCSQLKRFILQYIQMVNKTSSCITELTGNIAETSRVNRNTLYCITVPLSDFQLQITVLSIHG